MTLNLCQPLFHPDCLFPSDSDSRSIARRLYQEIRNLPIISPHGHTDPHWFSENQPFRDPASLLIVPDHYVLRMLYSQGISLRDLGYPSLSDARQVWKLFAKNFYLFRGTPTSLWFNWIFQEIFGLSKPLHTETADLYFDTLQAHLQLPSFLPRTLFEKFRIEVLCTTDAPTDSLDAHRRIQDSGWSGRVIPCFRPDSVLDPEAPHFASNILRLGEITQEQTTAFEGYLKALAQRRQAFIKLGASSTDHGHPTAFTTQLSANEASVLFSKALMGTISPQEAESFRGHMLIEMARMSLEDGLVMQIHPGSFRNHNPSLYQEFGPDRGADIPTRTDYVRALKPLLDLYGNESKLRLIVFTLDESTYSRELAPLAGHYPALRLGPAWWFHDSPEGMRRYREQVTETAGFYNTVGFNDDTRAFLSIPARHDIARRMDCSILSRWVVEHRLSETEALEVVRDLTYRIPKDVYHL